jgi:hypothetical protein
MAKHCVHISAQEYSVLNRVDATDRNGAVRVETISKNYADVLEGGLVRGLNETTSNVPHRPCSWGQCVLRRKALQTPR